MILFVKILFTIQMLIIYYIIKEVLKGEQVITNKWFLIFWPIYLPIAFIGNLIIFLFVRFNLLGNDKAEYICKKLKIDV